MTVSVSPQTFEALKQAAGIAGNIFAFGLFVSPIPTFRRIIRNRSTEQFSGIPYVYALLNCLICAWYGCPYISYDNLLVTTVNSVGAVFQLTYIIIYITCADKRKKVNMSLILLGVFGIFAIIAIGSLQIADLELRHLIIGFLSCATLISMFASPLSVMNLVIRTKSVEFMPFYLSLSTFLMSTSFMLYGVFNFDLFIYVPNGIGTLLGIAQLVLYFYYNDKSKQEHKEPLIESIA
ncbi:bidirectional sugar transporter SWEET2 [Rutidosis leptorrhynchoides]|uniref:bidirectional sugar transporter SWEET2 n=1 Tax=Rutidosis leptorrhynchoides TaxID=125765 RepID=UPI003A9A5E9B